MVAVWIRTLAEHRLARVAGAVLLLLFVWIESQGRNDLDIFLAASRKLFAGEDIYFDLYFGAYNYFYSTFFATLLYPLTWLPPVAAKMLWLLLQLFLAWRTGLRMGQWLGIQEWTKERRIMFAFLLLLVAARFLRGNLHLGQVTILLLWTSMEALHLVRTGRWARGAALLAFGINIKLLPVVLVPWLFYRAHIKTGVATIVCAAGLWFAPAAWLGWDHHQHLLGSWWELVDPAQDRHTIDTEATSLHSLTTLLPVFLMADPQDDGALTVRRYIADLSAEHVEHLILLARLLVIAGALFFLRTLPFREAPSSGHAFREISYLLLAAPLIFPHQQHYAFLFALPAMAWVLHYVMTHRVPWMTATYAFVALAFSASLLLGAFTAWYDHFKIVTWAALALIVLLAAARPEKKAPVLGPAL